MRPTPSLVIFRAAWSARAPTSAPPEQEKISFGAAPQEQGLSSTIFHTS
jgi:hypothetical protein